MQEKNKPHEISAAHSTVMECLGSSFSASFVMDIPLAGTEMLSGEGWCSEKDLLHFNCCWFVHWKCSWADCRWGTFPCCIAGQSWSAETVLRTMRISVCLILVLLPLFYWALKCDDWFESERNCQLYLNNLRKGGTWELLDALVTNKNSLQIFTWALTFTVGESTQKSLPVICCYWGGTQ